jgi:hypothetical protein
MPCAKAVKLRGEKITASLQTPSSAGLVLATARKNGKVPIQRFIPQGLDRELFGLWLSLVERAVRVGEVQGSNPCSPIFLPVSQISFSP